MAADENSDPAVQRSLHLARSNGAAASGHALSPAITPHSSPVIEGELSPSLSSGTLRRSRRQSAGRGVRKGGITADFFVGDTRIDTSNLCGKFEYCAEPRTYPEKAEAWASDMREGGVWLDECMAAIMRGLGRAPSAFRRFLVQRVPPAAAGTARRRTPFHASSQRRRHTCCG